MEYKTAEQKLLHDYEALESENMRLADENESLMRQLYPGRRRWGTYFAEHGRRLVLKECESWMGTEVRRDANGKWDDFDEWARRSFDELPDYMSRMDFMLEYSDELRALYDEELDKAVKSSDAEMG